MDALLERELELTTIELEEPVDDEPCIGSTCGVLAEWLGVWSCGHAYAYCAPHHAVLDRSRKIRCNQHHSEISVRLIRWERISHDHSC